MTDHVTGLVCVICGTAYPAEEAGYVCPDHGNEGILDVRYDYDLIGSRISREVSPGRARHHHVALSAAPSGCARCRRPTPHRWLDPHLRRSPPGRSPWRSPGLGEGRRPPTDGLAEGSGQCHGHRQGPGTRRRGGHDRQHRQRRSGAERVVRQHGPEERDLRSGNRPAGEDCPTARLRIDRGAGERHLRRRFRSVHGSRRRVRLVQPEHRATTPT